MNITRHAMKRFCARVRPEFDGRSVEGACRAYEAMRAMMEGKPMVYGLPWWKAESGAEQDWFVDAGDVAFMLKRGGGGKLYCTTVLTPVDERVPITMRRVVRAEIGGVK
jgi:hypothetical protein